jgi:tetratricopeptide (TPR) repeat protein
LTPRPFLAAALLVAALASCAPSEPDRLFREGEEAFHRGSFQQAADALGQLVELHPTDPRLDRALLTLGDLHYLFLNRPDEAMVFYRNLITAVPSSPLGLDARMKMAAIYRGRKSDCRKAVVEYQAVLDASPPPELAAEAQYRIASCYFSEGNIAQAEVEYRTLLEKYGGGLYLEETLISLGDCQAALGNPGRAMEFYRRVIENSADRTLAAQAGFGLASCLEMSGLRQEAMEAYRSVRDTHPNRQVVEERIARLEKKGGPVPRPSPRPPPAPTPR